MPLLFLVWEILRFGIMWSLVSIFFGTGRSYSLAFFVLWIKAPGLAVLAGFFLLWLQRNRDNRTLQVTLAMAKGFQAVFGISSAVLLLSAAETFQAAWLLMGSISLIDVAGSIVLLRTRNSYSAQGGNTTCTFT